MILRRLSSAVVSSLRTDVTVTTTAQCVAELVLNAIDAGATAIAVRVDLKNFKIQVIDNGCGLMYTDLNAVGTRYMTSKCNSLKDLQSNLCHFGFRGEALASISEVCGTMTIVSRHRDSEETFCKVFTKGTAHRVGKSNQPRASCGTTITVADFLYNRPVRRARIKPALDLESIKLEMESIALINPNVSFSLRNDITNELILQTHRSKDIPTVFGSLFGNTIAKNLVAVEESMGPFKIEGYISREAHLLKNLQFVYINKRLLLKTKLHKLVNSIMARSSIIKSNSGPYVPISKEISHGVLLAFSPPKRDKHAIFVLNITCPISEYDITVDPKKTLIEFCDWDCILSCLESLVRKFTDREAGLMSQDNCLADSVPPRKLRTVIDEMNQLDREEVLGPTFIQPTKNSIGTRDLSRAIHSLPASRQQVNLSPSDSSGCWPSTSESEFFSSAPTRSGVSSSAPTSAFTEKPYPTPLEKSLCKLKSKSTNGRDSCWTDTPISSVTPITRELPPVERVKCLLKQPHPLKVTGKKHLTNFGAESLHFEENFRKLTGAPIITNCAEDTMPSPINALANIKEIRRKKLLNNLNKFSFNMACEKPLLPKTKINVECSKVNASRTEIKEVSEEKLNKENGVSCKISKQKSPLFKMQQSVAVQTSTQVSLYAERGEKSDHQNAGKTLPKSYTLPTEDTDESIDGEGNQSKVQSFDLFSLSPLVGSGAISSEEVNDEIGTLESCRSENNSVMCPLENSISTGHTIIPRDFSEFGFTDKLKAYVEPPSLMKKSNEQSCSAPDIFGSWSKKDSQNSLFVSDTEKICSDVNDVAPSYVIGASLFDHKVETGCSPIDDVSPSERNSVIRNSLFIINDSSPEVENNAFLKSPHAYSEITEVENCYGALGISNDFDNKLSSQGDSITNYALNKSDEHVNSNCATAPELGMHSRKLVDYDSSPPSSQEIVQRIESLSESISSRTDSVKRKCDSPIDQSPKKMICPLSDTLPSSTKELGCELPVNGSSLSTTESSLIEVSGEVTHDRQLNSNNFLKEDANSVLSAAEDVSQENESGVSQLTDRHQLLDSAIDTLSQLANAGTCSTENSKVEEMEWSEELDQRGKTFYIHHKSGITTYKKPKEEGSTFKFHDRFSFLPKGMSPILVNKSTNELSDSPNIIYNKKYKQNNLDASNCKEEEDFSAIKWGNEREADKKTGFWPLVDQLLAEANNYSDNVSSESQVSNATAQELSKCEIKVYNVIFPYTFSKDIFQKLKVLGQLDNKFIVTNVLLDNDREIIVLFDQHAVHERIRVEKLTEDYKQNDGSAVWKSSDVDPPLPLSLSSIEVRILENYQDKMNDLGFYFRVIDSNTISVEGVPTCLLLRENRELAGRGVSVLRQHLESLIREQVDSILNTRGVGTNHPAIIQNVISSEACRGAVKFGHYLTVADCQAFLHNLSMCNLPFQCAHGRPALMPIIDLSQLKRKLQPSKPNLQKLKRIV